jgi:hypothetical protein
MNLFLHDIAFTGAVMRLSMGLHVTSGGRRDSIRVLFFFICVPQGPSDIAAIKGYASASCLESEPGRRAGQGQRLFPIAITS